MRSPVPAGAPGLALAALMTFPGPAAAAPPDASVRERLVHALGEAPGLELQMLEVAYPPGGASPPHRHHADVALYVLEGHLTMQVTGAAARTLGPGDTYYESPDDEHIVSANASATEPARFVVFMVRARPTPGPAAGARP